MVARIASRAFGDGLDLKWEKDVVGATPLADVAQVVAGLVAIAFYYLGQGRINGTRKYTLY